VSLARIVLLDPDLALARTLTRIIREVDYDVAAISRVSELAQALADAPSNLLLVDLVAAGCDTAPEIGRILEASSPRPDLLLVSSLPPDADSYRQLGATPGDFIAKPFRVHELLARIRSQLRDRTPAPPGPGQPLVRASAAVMADVTTGLTSAEVFQLLVRRVAQGLRIPRCSIILAQVGESRGTVVAAYDNPSIQSLPVDLARYPEIQRAMATGEVVHIADVATHPLYEEVRDAWRADGRSLPVTSAIAIRFSLRGEPAGVFFLRTAGRDAPLDEQDVDFAREIVEAAVRTLERIAASDSGAPAGA
jgi:two-component system cell cycle response regulator